MTPRDDERRKFEAWQLRIGSYSTRFVRDENGDYENTQADLLWRGWLARAEQAETPRTREELEKEWLAQTEWQDFTNWLIHVKLSTPAPAEDRPAPTPTARQKVYAFMQLPTHVKLERLRDLGIYAEGDCDLAGDECDLVWIKRAKESDLLNELLE